MSLVEQTLPVGKADHTIGMTNNQAFDDKPEFPLSKATTFDEPIFDKFDDMDNNQDVMAPSPNLANDEAPQLPAKSAYPRVDRSSSTRFSPIRIQGSHA